MKKTQKILIFSFIFYFLFFTFNISFTYSKAIELYFFFGQGCPYSAKIAQALQEIQKNFPQLKVNAFEVWFYPQNQKLLETLAREYKIRPKWVPVVFVGDLAVEGAEPSQIFQIKEEVRRCSIADCPSPIERIKVSPNKVQLNWKNIGIFSGVVIFLFLFINLLRKKK